MTEVDWSREVVDQIDRHWRRQLRSRLDGLVDDEYLWEPVPGWSIRPRGTCQSPTPIGRGAWQRDDAPDDPQPAPVTTIAWRLAHMTVEVLAMRTADHFGGPAAHYESWDYAGTATEALTQLDEQYGAWLAGLRSLDVDGLSRPCGPAEGAWSNAPLVTLVLHINRELIHHGAEVALLRDLYRQRTN